MSTTPELTDRQREVLDLLGRGTAWYSFNLIAQHVGTPQGAARILTGLVRKELVREMVDVRPWFKDGRHGFKREKSYKRINYQPETQP